MNDPESIRKITASCPSGHRVRGDVTLAGETVRCPKCQVEFVFAPRKSEGPDDSAITDTGVMRILGEAPSWPQASESREASTTRRPCSRCGNPVSVNASVCTHCQCYVGVLPHYLRQLMPSDAGSSPNA